MRLGRYIVLIIGRTGISLIGPMPLPTPIRVKTCKLLIIGGYYGRRGWGV